ncbi:heme exporter protein CcmB [Roseivirga misakiensis]|uniref:ABC transporter permease n=1 Tax=Roseivirga misakiensis TaxID=1563681 RepID=A0A1E5T5Z7_9BACT|nr:heme exporter protein CcmB [Roseivirga misakiensis]OEK06795.1 ABC transporter permease [Roseivirga misakiensis]
MKDSAIITLIKKEFLSEWRQRYALNGIVLYLASTIFVCYMSFGLKTGTLNGPTWNALLWIVLLFTATNAVAKSFIQESTGRLLYFYSIAKAESIIISKTIYYSLLLIVMAIIGLFFYSIVMGNPIQDWPMYLLIMVLGSIGLASALTMVSGIASKAPNSTSLMAIMSFPAIIPMLLVIIKTSKSAMDGIDRSVYMNQVLVLVAINAIIIAVSYMLFPYLWRS